MNAELTIQRAQKEDIPGLISLLLQVNNVHHAIRPDLFLENRTKYEAQTLEEMLLQEELPIFVAKDPDGLVRGYLFAQLRERSGPNLTGGRSFYIDDLCVDADARGTGIGHALLAYATEFAEKTGCREILLNVWEGNDSALRFYQNSGFRARSHILEITL